MEYPVQILAVGSFPEGNIEMVRESTNALPMDVEERISAVWGEELKTNPNLWSGPMLVARGIDVIEGAHLRVHCIESEYKYFMGTTHESVAPLIPDNEVHRAIGFLAVTITSDGYVMLGVRSPKIDWPTLRHVVPAGRLTPRQEHPYKGVRDEFKSELGLDEADIVSLTCLGVVADLTWRRLNYEFIFLARTVLSFRKVMERARSARSASEHCQLEPFPWNPYFLHYLLLVDPEGFVPTGFGGIALCLRQEFGSVVVPEWTPTHRTYTEHMVAGSHKLQKCV